MFVESTVVLVPCDGGEVFAFGVAFVAVLTVLGAKMSSKRNKMFHYKSFEMFPQVGKVPDIRLRFGLPMSSSKMDLLAALPLAFCFGAKESARSAKMSMSSNRLTSVGFSVPCLWALGKTPTSSCEDRNVADDA